MQRTIFSTFIWLIENSARMSFVRREMGAVVYATAKYTITERNCNG